MGGQLSQLGSPVVRSEPRASQGTPVMSKSSYPYTAPSSTSTALTMLLKSMTRELLPVPLLPGDAGKSSLQSPGAARLLF